MVKKWKVGILCIMSWVALITTPHLGWAGNALLSWAPNTEGNLAGYKIHYGTSSRAYTNTIDVGLSSTPSTPTQTVTDLEDGKTYYFALTAYDTSGNESSFSEEAQKTISQGLTANPLQDQIDSPMGGAGCGMIKDMSRPGTPSKWSLDMLLLLALLLWLPLQNIKPLRLPRFI
jgi:hypothetical protein